MLQDIQIFTMFFLSETHQKSNSSSLDLWYQKCQGFTTSVFSICSHTHSIPVTLHRSKRPFLAILQLPGSFYILFSFAFIEIVNHVVQFSNILFTLTKGRTATCQSACPFVYLHKYTYQIFSVLFLTSPYSIIRVTYRCKHIKYLLIS